jgi:hypothetical protein
MPPQTPIGMLMQAAINTTSNVPTTALPMPPPNMPAAGGSCVNSATLNCAPPRQISMISTEKSGMAASSVRAPQKQLIQKLNRVRGRFSERSRRERSSSPLLALTASGEGGS